MAMMGTIAEYLSMFEGQIANFRARKHAIRDFWAGRTEYIAFPLSESGVNGKNSRKYNMHTRVSMRFRTLAGMILAVALSGWPEKGVGGAPPPPIEAYGMLPVLEHAQLSPDGRMAAFLASVDGRRCVVVHDLDGSRKDQANCPGRFEVRWFAWKTNSRLLIGVYNTTRVLNNRFITESFLLGTDVDGANLKELVSPKQGRFINFNTDHVIDFLENDPAHVLVTLDTTSTQFPDVVAIDVNTGSTAEAAASTHHITSWITDVEGRPRLGVAIEDGKFAYLYRSAGGTDFAKVEGNDIIGETGFTLLAFSDKPNVLYVASEHETGRRCIYLYDVEARNVLDRYACRNDSDIDNLIMRGKHVLGYTYSDDQPHQVFIDPSWQRDAASIARKFANANIFLLDRTADGSRELVQVSEANRPPTIYVLLRTPGQPTRLEPLGDERPFIPDEFVAPVKPIAYRARDGLQIHGYLTMPLGRVSGPIPFVVLPHGGPYARDYLGFDYIAQMIASRGYGVLQPNFRGSTGYGRAFLEAGFREWGRKMQDDVTDATKWLIDQRLADPARICIFGWSYGGYAALMGAIREPTLYRCAASMAGVTDLKRMQPGSGRQVINVAVPVLNGDRSLIEENSPAKNAGKITIPILLAHGRQDVNVAFDDSVEMETALKDAGKKVDTIYFDGDDHFLYREGDRIAFLKKLDSFLRENLGSSPIN
jgi:dienelactone hydrolase